MINWGIISREVALRGQRARVGRQEEDSDAEDETEREDPAGRWGEASTGEPGGSRRRRPDRGRHATRVNACPQKSPQV